MDPGTKSLIKKLIPTAVITFILALLFGSGYRGL